MTMTELLSAINPATLKGKRDALIVRLIYECNIPTRTVLNLTADAVSIEKNLFIIQAEHRLWPLTCPVSALLAAWLNITELKRGVLFPRVRKDGVLLPDTGITVGTWYHTLEAYKRMCGANANYCSGESSFNSRSRSRTTATAQVHVL